MDIMELGAIGELVGGVAVIATLVYLALQIRRSSTAENARAVATLTDSWHQTTLHLLDPNTLAVFRQGLDEYGTLDDQDQFRFHVLAAQFIDRFDTMLHFEALGVTSRGYLSKMYGALVADFMKNDGFQQFWRKEGNYLGPHLQTWIRRNCPEAGEIAKAGFFDPRDHERSGGR